MKDARLVKRSLTIGGHRTSVALEAAFWRMLTAMAQYRGLSLPALVAELDAKRTAEHHPPLPLASTLRLAALNAAIRGEFEPSALSTPTEKA